ncbi:MAG: hypothetical protein IJ106_15640 [Parasporobacterium sp.]|nr:hypothetical protein [Parasporobacterium sp.]
MVVQEFGKENAATFLLLPGTSCTWEINFNMLLEPLSKEFHVLCVNYTGFDGENALFDTQEAETGRIEAYVIKHFGGHLDAMGSKYLKRYHKHYADPEIISFPCGHEGWLGNPQLMIETFHRCMKTETVTR